MLNRTPPAGDTSTAFATQLPQASEPYRPAQPANAVAVRQPDPYYGAPRPPAVYMPAIKDFLVTSLPVPLTAAIGGAVSALAGMHYASDILGATMFCATLLGVPGTFLMSKLLRNRQTDARAALAQLPAPQQQQVEQR